MVGTEMLRKCCVQHSKEKKGTHGFGPVAPTPSHARVRTVTIGPQVAPFVVLRRMAMLWPTPWSELPRQSLSARFSAKARILPVLVLIAVGIRKHIEPLSPPARTLPFRK